MNNLLAVFGLGLAGIDPVGMMILITAMAAGLPKKQVYLYAALVFFGTALLGFALSAALGSSLSQLADSVNTISDTAWVYINLFLSLLLAGWGIRRVLAKEEKEEDGKSGKGIYAAAAFMVFSALIDPTFIAVLALAGHSHNTAAALGYNFLWILLSQAPLFLLTASVSLNAHQKFISKFNSIYNRYKTRITHAITALIFLMALVFLIDLLYYLLGGIWLLG